MSSVTNDERAQQVIDSVREQLPGAWLGGRQRAVLTQAISGELRAAEQRGMERAAKLVPTKWGDPVLTGADCLGRWPYSDEDIKRLLKRLARKIRQEKENV